MKTWRETASPTPSQCIGNDKDVLSHDLPGFSFAGIISFLELGDLGDVMGPVSSNQTPNGIFRKIGIGSAEEYGDLVGI